MPQGPPRRRRARPVADAPIDALVQRVDELAQGWLLALLEQAALSRAPDVLAAELVQDGPRLLEASVVRAERSGAGLALLVAELEDASRVVAVEAQDGASVIFDGVAGAVREAIERRRGRCIVREADERRWVVIASDTD
jgi:hypothetical protein